MKSKPQLFIHDRKEMVVLTLLVVMIALFTFTLGVHLGKKTGFKVSADILEQTGLIGSVSDQIPNRQELTEQSKGAQNTVESVLHHELQEEVKQNSLKITQQHQVDLPEKTKSPHGGATTLAASHSHSDHKAQSHERPKEHVAPVHGHSGEDKYALQIGSFPSLEEAKKHLSALNQSELKPFLREAELKGKGKWYRIYVGDYANRSEAEKAGEKYRSEKLIQSFIVAKLSSE